MSFSRNAKLEIMAKPITSDCCGLSFLCGLFFASGNVTIENNIVKSLTILTDNQELYTYVNNIFHTLYGEFAEITITDDFKINKTTYYKISFPIQHATRLLLDIGYISLDNNKKLVKNSTIYKNNILEECCKKSFVKGAFVGCGTSNIKISQELTEKTNSGYHIEFSSHNLEFLETISEILLEYSIVAKIVKRKNNYVLYVKEASQVSDILAMIGAFESVLELNNEMAKREIRNKINRQNNCDTANISKIVDASIRQIKAIKQIQELFGLENLPDDLQNVALLRLANPEESLDNLLKLSKLPYTKSGLNYRYKKLEKIAEKIKN